MYQCTGHDHILALSDSLWIYRRYINKSIYLSIYLAGDWTSTPEVIGTAAVSKDSKVVGRSAQHIHKNPEVTEFELLGRDIPAKQPIFGENRIPSWIHYNRCVENQLAPSWFQHYHITHIQIFTCHTAKKLVESCNRLSYFLSIHIRIHPNNRKPAVYTVIITTHTMYKLKQHTTIHN